MCVCHIIILLTAKQLPFEVVIIIVFCCEVDSLFHLVLLIVNWFFKYSAMVLRCFVNINKYCFCFYLKSQTVSMMFRIPGQSQSNGSPLSPAIIISV